MAEQRESANDNESLPERAETRRTSAQDEDLTSELLDQLTPEDRRQVTQTFSMMAAVSGRLLNPIVDKITSEHISKTIDNAEAESKRESEAGYSIRRYTFLYFVVELSAVLA